MKPRAELHARESGNSPVPTPKSEAGVTTGLPRSAEGSPRAQPFAPPPPPKKETGAGLLEHGKNQSLSGLLWQALENGRHFGRTVKPRPDMNLRDSNHLTTHELQLRATYNKAAAKPAKQVS